MLATTHQSQFNLVLYVFYMNLATLWDAATNGVDNALGQFANSVVDTR